MSSTADGHAQALAKLEEAIGAGQKLLSPGLRVAPAVAGSVGGMVPLLNEMAGVAEQRLPTVRYRCCGTRPATRS